MQDVGDFCIVSDCVLEKCAREQKIKKHGEYIHLKLSDFWQACRHILMCISNSFKMCIDKVWFFAYDICAVAKVVVGAKRLCFCCGESRFARLQCSIFSKWFRVRLPTVGGVVFASVGVLRSEKEFQKHRRRRAVRIGHICRQHGAKPVAVRLVHDVEGRCRHTLPNCLVVDHSRIPVAVWQNLRRKSLYHGRNGVYHCNHHGGVRARACWLQRCNLVLFDN